MNMEIWLINYLVGYAFPLDQTHFNQFLRFFAVDGRSLGGFPVYIKRF